tara:strand:- start:11003 stop:11554 length:552 start_codon:yes stop_codon:yes gene_type:complete
MLKFFGISKKEKVSSNDVSNILSVALNKVVDNGFSEIQSFLNHNQNLEKSPNIKDEDLRSFRLIIFVANIYLMSTKFEESETLILRNKVIDNILPIIGDDNEISMDLFLNYEMYFRELVNKKNDTIDSMAIAIFDKYKINDCQSELLRRKNEPNPILYNELKKYLSHFIWNWDEFLEKCKIVF